MTSKPWLRAPRIVGPDKVIVGGLRGTGDEAELTDAQLEEFAAAWRKAFLSAPRHRRAELLTPLPRRVRLRLWAASKVDGLGSWLAGHHASWAAIAMWRILGMWP